jgi:lipopolysaccharide export system permease protein
LILYKYILKSHIGPFLFAFATVVFLFLFQFIYKTIDQLVGKGLSIWLIVQLISYNMAWIVTLAVPMAVLVATLMAFGNLASTNELTIIKAGGISLRRMMIPVILCSIILFYLMVKFNNEVLPEANHQARVLLGDISRTKPTFILEPGKFSDDIGGAKILVRKIDPVSNKLEDIYIYDYSNPQVRNIFTAKSGDIGFTADLNNIVMNLENGEIHQLNVINPSQKYKKVKFNKHRITLSSEGFGLQQSGEGSFRGDRELSADSMVSIRDSLIAQVNDMSGKLSSASSELALELAKIPYRNLTIRRTGVTSDSLGQSLNQANSNIISLYDNVIMKKTQRQGIVLNSRSLLSQVSRYEVEIYKKYSIPFACIVFVLIGAPLGYRVKKGGFGISAGFSLLFFLIYWASLIGGEKLADRGLLSPLLGMWIADIVLGIFGLYLMFKSS